MEVHNCCAEPWRITLVETGDDSMTGGRLKRVRDFVGDETFCFTYGDGVSNVNIRDLIAFHKAQGALATLTAVQPPGRFGAFKLEHGEDKISSFKEKPDGDGAWVNSGFFVLEPGVMDYIEGDLTVWEKEPMERLAGGGELSAYRHHGFWQPMDTLRDKHVLEGLWQSGQAPWRVW
jgi:glucose-1-phosphate cytidylyltransferase